MSIKCTNLGEGPQGKPCQHYARGSCRSTESCPFQAEISQEELAAKAEKIEIPDRVTDLLARIASGNLKIDDQFLNSDTYRAMYEIAQITAHYDPLSDGYEAHRLEDPNQMETDGLHLAALNVRLGQVHGLLQADVESLESYLKELEAKKSLSVETSLRQGLRPGGYKDGRVRSIVSADDQVIESRDALMQAKRRTSIVGNMCDRVESTINMIKKRADALRRHSV